MKYQLSLTMSKSKTTTEWLEFLFAFVGVLSAKRITWRWSWRGSNTVSWLWGGWHWRWGRQEGCERQNRKRRSGKFFGGGGNREGRVSKIETKSYAKYMLNKGCFQLLANICFVSLAFLSWATFLTAPQLRNKQEFIWALCQYWRLVFGHITEYIVGLSDLGRNV